MKKTKNIVGHILLVIVPSLVCIVIAEITLRNVMPDKLALKVDERAALFSYDDTLGWFPKPNSKGVFEGSRTIHVKQNMRGFRDNPHNPGSKKSIIVLGDSFVWGYDVEAEERFTDIMDTALTNWDVFNLGVSGYGTDQEFLLLQQQYDFYEPDMVFLVFCTDNDRLDNSMNKRYRDYYKPYFTYSDTTLSLQGIPVPKGLRYHFANNKLLLRSYIVRLAVNAYYEINAPFVFNQFDPTNEILKAIQEYTRRRGSSFVIGLQGKDDRLEQFLENEGIDFLNLENDFKYPQNGQHWTPEGHNFVANKVRLYINDQ